MLAKTQDGAGMIWQGEDVLARNKDGPDICGCPLIGRPAANEMP